MLPSGKSKRVTWSRREVRFAHKGSAAIAASRGPGPHRAQGPRGPSWGLLGHRGPPHPDMSEATPTCQKATPTCREATPTCRELS